MLRLLLSFKRNRNACGLIQELVRVPNHRVECIGYRLNLLGVRVYRNYAQLVARSGSEWVTIGPPRDLPVEVPNSVAELGTDTLLLTAYQYIQENPDTDLPDLLSGRKALDDALRECPV